MNNDIKRLPNGDFEVMQMAKEVPLVELLESVPQNARLFVDDEDGNGTTHYPVGHLCQEAAKALRDRLAQPNPPPECQTEAEKKAFAFGWWKAMEKKREWVGLTDGDIAKTMHGSVEGSNMLPYQFARAIEDKLKEKNSG